MYSKAGPGRRDFFRIGGAGLAVAGMPPTLAACSRAQQGVSLEELREQGFVRAGIANEQPYGFVDDSGEVTGQSPELAKAVFAELGVDEVRADPVAWDGLIPGLTSGRFDLVAAGMFINPERCEQVLFANPEAQATEAFLVAEGNPHEIAHFEDFVDNPDITLAVLNASVEQDYAEHFGIPADQLREIPDQSTGYELLESGRVDAVSMPTVSMRWLLQERGGPYEVTEGFVPVIDGEEQIGAGGLVFDQGATEIVEEVNRVLAEFKESGRVLEIGEPFGFGEEEQTPADLTAEELCQN